MSLVGEHAHSVVVLHIKPLNCCSGVELVPRCEPSTYQLPHRLTADELATATYRPVTLMVV